MAKNIYKIYRPATFMILVIIVSGLLNLCLFAFQAKVAAKPSLEPQINFSYDNDGNCVAEPRPEPRQTINRPAAPMPECCLAQNRNYNALVKTANDKSVSVYFGPIILSSIDSPSENSSAYHASRLTHPPPAALALASTVIRE